MALPLKKDEEEAIRAEFHQKLQEEHHDRLDELAKKRARAKARSRNRSERKANADIARIHEEMREKFYKEQGYREYVDSVGRRHMVPPEEYDWRVKVRKRRGPKYRVHRETKARTRQLIGYGIVLMIAIVAGLILAR